MYWRLKKEIKFFHKPKKSIRSKGLTPIDIHNTVLPEL